MYYFVAFVCGVLTGAVGAVIFYRRHMAEVEAKLADAVAARNKVASAVGGKG